MKTRFTPPNDKYRVVMITLRHADSDPHRLLTIVPNHYTNSQIFESINGSIKQFYTVTVEEPDESAKGMILHTLIDQGYIVQELPRDWVYVGRLVKTIKE